MEMLKDWVQQNALPADKQDVSPPGGPGGVGEASDFVTSSDSKDPTRPGLPASRKEPITAADNAGGAAILWNTVLNKGTSFTKEERVAKRLEGLLPPAVEPLELQAERVMWQLHNDTYSPLQKYELMFQTAATSMRLFFKVLIDNLVELAPIVYTPTVGEACQKFHRIFRTSLGVYPSAFEHRGRMHGVLSNWPSHNVQIVVLTDGGRILGLGDLGVNGMGIPLGKIALYVAGAGFHPEHSLPMTIDCGTDNVGLREDKFYLGARQARLHGEEHLAAVEELCNAIHAHWPDAVIQLEDFQTEPAFALLERLGPRMALFDDDIQGTGAVVAAGFLNGMKAQGTPLGEARIVFFGAGSAAVGVAKMIASLIHSLAGVPEEQARKAIYMVDTKGLLTHSRGDKLPSHKQEFARDDVDDLRDLREIVARVKPHAVIGLSGAPNSFTKEVIEELCQHQPRPLVFPLSNPTDKSEITAEDAVRWCRGNLLFAAGSPFDPVEYEGRQMVPGQANNVFIFPGVGFGAVMAKARTIPDEMFVAAAQSLADYVSPEEIRAGKIYPDLKELRDISARVACAVADAAFEQGVARAARPAGPLEAYIRSRMWAPDAQMAPTPLDDPRAAQEQLRALEVRDKPHGESKM